MCKVSRKGGALVSFTKVKLVCLPFPGMEVTCQIMSCSHDQTNMKVKSDKYGINYDRKSVLAHGPRLIKGFPWPNTLAYLC